ncbi:MAG: response regulator [Chloroflexi bacterium]|nr:response regulator [Chloroflexota bacterium]
METKKTINILIVEDENITAKALEYSLQDAGYNVVGVVSSGEEAIRRAASKRPDLVLMDIRLKGMIDGVSAAQRIQAHLDIPVIFLTAHSDPGTFARVIHSSPYGYIVKPFIEEELYNTIERALDRHKLKGRT